PVHGGRWFPPGDGGRGARGGRSGRPGLTDPRIALSDVRLFMWLVAPFTLPFITVQGGFFMRKCIGSALLLVMLAAYPALGAAQRRAAARPAARSADRPSFGLQLDWGNDPNFGIGGRGVFPLGFLVPGAPLDGIVS